MNETHKRDVKKETLKRDVYRRSARETNKRDIKYLKVSFTLQMSTVTYVESVMSHVTHMKTSDCSHENKRLFTRKQAFSSNCLSSCVLRVKTSKCKHISSSKFLRESCHTYEWAMSQIWIRHVMYVEFVMSQVIHTKTSNCKHISSSKFLKNSCYVTNMNESCHTYEWVMSHIWMSHVTNMRESCHTYEWVMSHRFI